MATSQTKKEKVVKTDSKKRLKTLVLSLTPSQNDYLEMLLKESVSAKMENKNLSAFEKHFVEGLAAKL